MVILVSIFARTPQVTVDGQIAYQPHRSHSQSISPKKKTKKQNQQKNLPEYASPLCWSVSSGAD